MALHLSNSNSSMGWQQEVDNTLNRRRTDEVKKVGHDACQMTTSIQTKYEADGTAIGTIFTVVPKVNLEVLTIEFLAFELAEDLRVQVYGKKGDFSGATSDKSQWEELSDALAVKAIDNEGALIPARDFRPTQLQADERYSFYLHFQKRSIMKNRPSPDLIGTELDGDDRLSIQVGVSLDEGPFPSVFGAVSEFTGIIHYRTRNQCDSVKTNSVVKLEFAVNAEPTADVLTALSEAVEGATSALLMISPDLITFSKYHLLEIDGVKSNFMGRSVEKCPAEFDTCSLITAVVTVSHLQSITQGNIQTEIFKETSSIEESVVTQSEFEVEFVGEAVTTEEFVFTLKGVPANSMLIPLQRTYFERVTADFLSELSETDIYQVKVVDQIMTNSNPENESDENKRRLESGGLRGMRRRLEPTGNMAVIASVDGGASLQSSVISSLLGNEKDYVAELAFQQLRPGEINENDSGKIFESLVGIAVSLHTGLVGSGRDDDGAQEESDEPTLDWRWIGLSLVAFFISVGWLGYLMYKDMCYVEPEEKKTLGDVGPKIHQPAPPGNFELFRRPSDDLSVTNDSSIPRFRSRSAERRPSSDDGKRPLDIATMHDRTAAKRGSSLDRLRNSDHGPSTTRPSLPSRFQTNRPSKFNTQQNQNNNDKTGNKAGENGRGIRPTKSTPLDFMRQRPGTNSTHSKNSTRPKPSDDDEDDTICTTPSKHDPENKRLSLPRRGVGRNKSMPAEAQISTPTSKVDASSPKAGASKIADPPKKNLAKNKAGEKRGVQRAKSLPDQLIPANKIQQKKAEINIKASNPNKESSNVDPPKKHAILSKSDHQPVRAVDWRKADPDDFESESSEESDLDEEMIGIVPTPLSQSSALSQSSELPRTAGGRPDEQHTKDFDSESSEESDLEDSDVGIPSVRTVPSKKHVPLNLSQHMQVAKPTTDQPPEQPENNPGRPEQPVSKSTSMPVTKKTIPQKEEYDDPYSSDESDIEQSFETSKAIPQQQQNNVVLPGRGVSKNMSVPATKKKTPLKLDDDDPYSSDESDICLPPGDRIHPKKRIPRGLSDDESTAKKAPVKRHLQRSLSDDESPANKNSVQKPLPRSSSFDECTAKKPLVKKYQPGSLSGNKGRVNNIPPKKHLPTNSSGNSLAKETPPKKHLPRSLSGDDARNFAKNRQVGLENHPTLQKKLPSNNSRSHSTTNPVLSKKTATLLKKDLITKNHGGAEPVRGVRKSKSMEGLSFPEKKPSASGSVKKHTPFSQQTVSKQPEFTRKTPGRSRSSDFIREAPGRSQSREFGKAGKIKFIRGSVNSSFGIHTNAAGSSNKPILSGQKGLHQMQNRNGSGWERPRELQPRTTRDVERGNLRRSHSNERREAVKDHLKVVLGDDSSTTSRMTDSSHRNKPNCRVQALDPARKKAEFRHYLRDNSQPPEISKLVKKNYHIS